MLQTCQDLRLFNKTVLEAIKAAIRSSGGGGAAGLKLLDEVGLLVDDDADLPEEPAASPTAAAEPTAVPATGAAPPAAGTKRKREDGDASRDAEAAAAVAAARRAREAAAKQAEADVKPSVSSKALEAKVQATVDRICASPLDKPFAILGMQPEGASGAAIRKAYRRVALVIHPDKLSVQNHELMEKCKEAYVKLQAAREQAEADLQRADVVKVSDIKGETRSAATQNKNEDADGIFRCKYPGCDLPPCKQCANGCCTRNITHCHLLARSKGGQQCFFHPPPRAWARNA
jgi:hypothetical protein